MENSMETIYGGMKIVSKAYPLLTGEWMLEAMVWSKTPGGVIQRLIRDDAAKRFPSEWMAHEGSIKLGKNWIDSN